MVENNEVAPTVLADIQKRYRVWSLPKRTPISVRFPVLVPVVLFVRRRVRAMSNQQKYRKVYAAVTSDRYPVIQYGSQSLLRRRLGAADPRLQEGKITNLKQAIPHISYVVIKPGEVFSLWKLLGNTTYARGYVDGMVLSSGRVGIGPGGGLCQLANLLHWVFLHTDMTVVERFHHSYDVFPDNGRTLPFGSGATIFYNAIDLKVQNTSSIAWQIVVWLDDDYVYAEVRTEGAPPLHYKIKEAHHHFISTKKMIFRYNQIWRRSTNAKGEEVSHEYLFTNFAPVLYPVAPEKITVTL